MTKVNTKSAAKNVAKKTTAAVATRKARTKPEPEASRPVATTAAPLTQLAVPLSKLKAGNNPRRARSRASVAKLAASLHGRGQLQNLVVRPEGDEFVIIAGHGRHEAFMLNLEKGLIAADHPVYCLVREPADKVEAIGIAIAENEDREDLHPVDRFRAYRDMIEAGGTIDDVSARHGVSPHVVNQYLALARLAPEILDAATEDTVSLALLQAYAISDDHDAQRAVFERARDYDYSPSQIRAMLTTSEVPASHPRAQFIGIDAYEAAGGEVRRDLFADGVFLRDAGLVNRLVLQRLEAEAQAIQDAEGWKWVNAYLTVEDARNAVRGLARLFPETVPNQRFRELNEKMDGLETELDQGARDANVIRAEMDTISLELDLLYEFDEVFPAGAKAVSGVAIWFDISGQIGRSDGIVLPAHMDAMRAYVASLKDDGEEDDGADAPTDEEGEQGGVDRPPPVNASAGSGSAVAVHVPVGKPGRPPISQTLRESLAYQRTEILQQALMGNPEVALVASVHVLAGSAFYGYSGYSCLRLYRSEPPKPIGQHVTPAAEAITARIEAIKATLPEKQAELWEHLMALSTEDLLSILAVCVAQGIDTTERRGEESGRGIRLEHGQQLADTLGCDLSRQWVPNGANYLAHVSKAMITDAVTEACGASAALPIATMKKDEAIAHAERVLAGTGWLPEMLCPTSE